MIDDAPRKSLSAACSAAAALLVLCLPAASAAAQDRAAVAPGERVRVVIPAGNGGSDQYVTGTLARLAGDTATILVNSTGWRPDSLRYALNDSTGRRLEHVVATQSHGGRGALIGALVGAGVGLVIGVAADDPHSFFNPGPGFYAAVFAVPGAALGYVSGVASRSETWGPVQTSGVHIGISPTTARLTFTLSTSTHRPARAKTAQ